MTLRQGVMGFSQKMLAQSKFLLVLAFGLLIVILGVQLIFIAGTLALAIWLQAEGQSGTGWLPPHPEVWLAVAGIVWVLALTVNFAQMVREGAIGGVAGIRDGLWRFGQWVLAGMIGGVLFFALPLYMVGKPVLLFVVHGLAGVVHDLAQGDSMILDELTGFASFLEGWYGPLLLAVYCAALAWPFVPLVVGLRED